RTLRMKLLAQQAIAFDSVFSSASVSAKDRSARLIQLLENEAQTPEEKLNVAILAGYLQGPNATSTYTPGRAGNSHALRDDLDAIKTIYIKGAAGLSSADRDRFVSRHGYFADLALASGPSADAEMRRAIESSARRLLAMLALVVLA